MFSPLDVGRSSLVLFRKYIDTLILFFYIFGMKSYQLTIPVENKPCVLASITSILARKKINIRSASITSFGDSGLINLIVDDPKQGHKALSKEGIPVELKEVIAVLIEDRPGGLDKLLQMLCAEKINIENGYGFVIESRKNAVFILEIKDSAQARELIEASGFKTLTPQQLSEIEPFHYVGY
jgi:hypothetical protein